ncbi:MAG: hypothetical protein K2J78_03930 [Muribaculaceae bacterium]|nr:hypothetical protein [Muribaculaceae bacterium]
METKQMIDLTTRNLWLNRILVTLLLSAGDIILFHSDSWAWPIIGALYFLVTTLFLRTSPILKKFGNWIGLWIAALILFLLNFTIVTHVLSLSYSGEHYNWGVIGILPLYSVYSLIVLTTFFLIIREKSAKTLDGLFYTYYHFSATKVIPGTAIVMAIALLEICGLAFTIPLLLLTECWPFDIYFTETDKAVAVGIFALIWLLFLLTYFLGKKRYKATINQYEKYNKSQCAFVAIIWPLITLIGAILYIYLKLTLPITQDVI